MMTSTEKEGAVSPPAEKDATTPEPSTADCAPAQIFAHAELVQQDQASVSLDQRRRIEAEITQRALAEAPEAQVVVHRPQDSSDSSTPPKGEEQRRGRIGLLLLCFSVAVIAVVVIALAASGRFEKSNKSTRNDKQPINSVNITDVPESTAVPTTSSPTTSSLTEEVSETPSISVNPTPSPSMHPTHSPTLGDNQDCDAAHPVGIGYSNRAVGSIANRTIEDVHQFVCAQQVFLANPGLWYRFQSEKTQPVTTHVTDGYFAHVFGAPTSVHHLISCSFMLCVSSILYEPTTRRESWIAEAGKVYLVAVLFDASPSSTIFELSLLPNDNSMFPYGPITPDWALFPGSVAVGTSLIPSDGDSSSIRGGNDRRLSINNSFGSANTMADESLAPSCGSATAQTTGGAWYSVIGNGELIEVATCGLADWDTQISVFELETYVGADLTPADAAADTEYDRWRRGEISFEALLSSRTNHMQCVVGDDDSCGAQQSRTVWSSKEGHIYYVLVHGKPGQGGDFQVSIADASIPEVIDGDHCTNALDTNHAVFVISNDPIIIGDNIISDEDLIDCSMGGDIFLDSATPDANVPSDCHHNLGFPRLNSTDPTGLWYRVDGTGKLFTLKAPYFTNGAQEALGLSVMGYPRRLRSAGCDQLICMIQDCINGCSWQTDKDYTYVLYGYGFPEITGLHGLSFYIIETES